jgi:hypothetical protein
LSTLSNIVIVVQCIVASVHHVIFPLSMGGIIHALALFIGWNFIEGKRLLIVEKHLPI